MVQEANTTERLKSLVGSSKELAALDRLVTAFFEWQVRLSTDQAYSHWLGARMKEAEECADLEGGRVTIDVDRLYNAAEAIGDNSYCMDVVLSLASQQGGPRDVDVTMSIFEMGATGAPERAPRWLWVLLEARSLADKLAAHGIPDELAARMWPSELRKARQMMAPWVKPVISIDRKTTKVELLGQVCLWGIRQGIFDNSKPLELYLYEYVRGRIRSSRVKDEDVDYRIADRVSQYLQKNWSRPESARSWDTMINFAIKGEVVKLPFADEALDDGSRCDKQSSTRSLREGPFSVSQVARETGIAASTIYHSIHTGRIEAEVVEVPPVTHTTPGGLLVTRTRSRYFLSGSAVDELRDSGTKKSDVVALVSLRRGVGLRAAQRWVKRRLEAGRSLREIAEEVRPRT
jgi:hypothetical protein